MAHPSTGELIALARSSGYAVIAAEQLRINRWLLTLAAPDGATTLALIQARPMINASDVQDLAELARLRAPQQALLVALGGRFSPMAMQTHAELGDARLRLCATLPPAPSAEPEIGRAAVLKQVH